MLCIVCDIVMVIKGWVFYGCVFFFFISLEPCYSDCNTFIKIPLMAEFSHSKMLIYENGGNCVYSHANILYCRSPHCHGNSLLM